MIFGKAELCPLGFLCLSCPGTLKIWGTLSSSALRNTPRRREETLLDSVRAVSVITGRFSALCKEAKPDHSNWAVNNKISGLLSVPFVTCSPAESRWPQVKAGEGALLGGPDRLLSPLPLFPRRCVHLCSPLPLPPVPTSTHLPLWLLFPFQPASHVCLNLSENVEVVRRRCVVERFF